MVGDATLTFAGRQDHPEFCNDFCHVSNKANCNHCDSCPHCNNGRIRKEHFAHHIEVCSFDFSKFRT